MSKTHCASCLIRVYGIKIHKQAFNYYEFLEKACMEYGEGKLEHNDQ